MKIFFLYSVFEIEEPTTVDDCTEVGSSFRRSPSFWEFFFLLVTFSSSEIPDAPVPVQTEGDSAAPPEVLRTPAGCF